MYLAVEGALHARLLAASDVFCQFLICHQDSRRMTPLAREEVDRIEVRQLAGKAHQDQVVNLVLLDLVAVHMIHIVAFLEEYSAAQIPARTR